MEEELKIGGNKYSGVFKANFITESYHHNGDTHDRHNHYWEGQAKIIRLEDQETIRVLFQTRREGNANFVGKLEHAILCFTSKFVSWPKRPEIVEYNEVVDLVLEPMYQKYFEEIKDEKIIVPKLIVPVMDIDKLVREELITIP